MWIYANRISVGLNMALNSKRYVDTDVAFEVFLECLVCVMLEKLSEKQFDGLFRTRDYGGWSVCMGIFNARCKWDYMVL